MNAIRALIFTLCLLAAIPAAALPHGALAGLGAPAPEATAQRKLQVAQSGGVSLSQAVEQVRRQYNPQRVISAETKRSGNREVHHIKILTRDNKVKTVRVNGRTLSGRG